MDAEDIALVERDIEKNLRAYRRLTGEAVEIDSMIDETAAWLTNNFHRYLSWNFNRGLSWVFPCVDTPYYERQRLRLRHNRLDDFMDTVDALAKAQPEGVDTRRVRRAVERQQKYLQKLCYAIQDYVWLAGLRQAVAKSDRMKPLSPLLVGGVIPFSPYHPPRGD